jgi:hypothetical protein
VHFQVSHTLREPPYDAPGIPRPDRRCLRTMWRRAANIRNSEFAQVAAEIEGLVVQPLINYRAIEVDRAQQAEGRDNISCEVYLGPRFG